MATITEREELKRKIQESMRLLNLYDANHISNGIEIMKNKDELMKKYNQLLLQINSNVPIKGNVTLISKKNKNIPFCSSEESYVYINENTKSSVSQDRTKINIDNGMYNYLIQDSNIDLSKLKRLLVLIKIHCPNINASLQSFCTSDSLRLPNLTKSREYALDKCYVISTSEPITDDDIDSMSFESYDATEMENLGHSTIKKIFSRELTDKEYNYTAGLSNTKLTQEYIKGVFINNLRQDNPNVEISLFSKGDHYYIKCNPNKPLNRPFDSGMDGQVCMITDRMGGGYDIFTKSQTVTQYQCNEKLEIIMSQPYRNPIKKEDINMHSQNIERRGLNSNANNLGNGIDNILPTTKPQEKYDQNINFQNFGIDELIKRIEARILELTEKEKNNNGYGSTLYQRLNNRQDALYAQNQNQMNLINQMRIQMNAMQHQLELLIKQNAMLQQQLSNNDISYNTGGKQI